jgi:serine/threonine protein phosphatase PrpC
MTMDPANDLPAVEYAERSDPGRDPSKQINEDACGRRETALGHLCVVCDGMGGHAAGREAAELALATIFESFEGAQPGASPAATLRAAVEEASRRVYSMPTSEIALGRPGSTMVAVLMHAQGTEVVHVGDSRAYLIHEGQISRVTRDHSIVQEMVDRGLLTQEQATHHPDANRITRALGMAPEIEAELRPQPVQHVTGDAFVLCSDGLSDLVDDREILETVGGVPAAQAVGKLVDMANARGGHDNITVLVLRARSGSFVPSAGPSTGVAPTVAQTGVTQATLPAPTFIELAREAPIPEFARGIVDGARDRAVDGARDRAVDGARDRATDPSTPESARPLEPTPLPTAARRRPGRIGAVVVAGIGLAGVAVALLAVILASHIKERGGTHNPSSETTALALGAEAGEAPPPTPLVPQRVELPAPSAAPDEALAPLEPAPPAEPPPRRKKKKH